MGPIIILDKSSIQSLSAQELEFLYRYYLLNIPPILLIEILGDLRKPNKEGSLTGDEVIQLSNKLLQISSAINVHCEKVLVNSLLGQKIIMDGRPLISGGKRIQAPGGKIGVIYKESLEEQAIHRWRTGNFTEAEALLSARWKQSTKQIDLQYFKERYKLLNSYLPETESFNQLVEVLDKILLISEIQFDLLTLLTEVFNFEQNLVSQILSRWKEGHYQLTKDFAPYAFYCLRATLAFYIGLIRNYIGTRPTNQIDLEYIYYLPFTMVFSSRDKFHKTVVPAFLRPDQIFVQGDELKRDLNGMVELWNTLNEQQRDEWFKENKLYPPKREDSFTFKMWQRLCGPKKKTDVVPYSTSSYDKQSIVDIIKNIEKEGKLIENADDSPVQFMLIENRISIEDPCPCGSGKKLKDCCLEKANKSTIK